MRIIQVVTYHSPDGAFGGPTRVAEAQCAELAAQGNSVSLWAAAPVDKPRVEQVDGYERVLFPGRRLTRRLGFAGMHAPGMLRALRGRLSEADIVHIHLARDLVSLPIADAVRRAGVPYVVQPHGMIDPSDKCLARPLDRWWTKPVLRSAGNVLSLTSQEDDDLRGVAGDVKVTRIENGLRTGVFEAVRSAADATDHEDQVVLFLARLHERKRPVAFVEMASEVATVHTRVRFVLAGPDEGELEGVLAARARLNLERKMEVIGAVPPDQTDALISAANVLVLPSVGEIFPMTVLEAFRAGTPVVVTDSLGIAERCAAHGAAMITDGSPLALARAVGKILADPGVGARLVAGGRTFLESELDIAAVARTLVAKYEEAQRA